MDVEVKDLYKSFGDNQVLRGLNLKIRRGERTVIVGGSGSGKTVFLKHLIGLLRPDKGQILIDGQDITHISERKLLPLRQKIGIIFQSGGLLNSLTVGDNIALALREHRLMPEDKIKELVEEKLTMLGLAGKSKEMPANLSEGMKKRVSIARALITNPEMILYDEPTVGLDPPMAENIDNLIQELNEKLGVTSVVVTHDMISVFTVADSVHMLYQGTIIESATPAEFIRSDNPVVKEFLHRTQFRPAAA